MILQLIGGACIIAASSAIGYDYARRLEKRVDQLNDLKLGLSAIQTEMSFKNVALGMALIRVAEIMQTDVRELFGQSGEYLWSKRGITVKEAWSIAVDGLKNSLSLRKEDYNILSAFAAQLGSSDLSSQLENIELAQAKLDLAILKAREQTAKYSKLYRVSGVLGGIFITVLFI